MDYSVLLTLGSLAELPGAPSVTMGTPPSVKPVAEEEMSTFIVNSCASETFAVLPVTSSSLGKSASC